MHVPCFPWRRIRTGACFRPAPPGGSGCPLVISVSGGVSLHVHLPRQAFPCGHSSTCGTAHSDIRSLVRLYRSSKMSPVCPSLSVGDCSQQLPLVPVPCLLPVVRCVPSAFPSCRNPTPAPFLRVSSSAVTVAVPVVGQQGGVPVGVRDYGRQYRTGCIRSSGSSLPGPPSLPVPCMRCTVSG